MSWFPSRDDLDAFEDDALDVEASAFEAKVEQVGEEVAPGVIVERRTILRLPFALAGTAALGLLAPIAAQDRKRQGYSGQDPAPSPKRGDTKDPARRISFDQLLDQLQPLAEGITADPKPNEEAYLHSVASMLQRLDLENLPKRGRRPPLAVMQLRLKPNAVIPYHDHRNMNGVILGLEGDIRVRNYEILGEDPVPPEDEAFRIRETVDACVTPGRTSTLARGRDNIHHLRAGDEGGLVLDMFTFFGKKDVASHFVTVEEKPIDEKRRIYEARWRES